MISSDELIDLYTWTYNAIKDQAMGVTQEASLHHPLGGGNCLNWVVGHIVAGRSNVLSMLGAPTIWSYSDAKSYLPGSMPLTDGAGAYPLERIMIDLDRTQDGLIAALRGQSADALAATKGDKTLAAELLAYGLHEAYHAGQTELLRCL
jgi:hypothetical protein